MKNLKVVLVAFALVVSGVMSASTVPGKDKRSVSAEIGELLKSPSFKIKQDIKAEVTFTLNKDKEIVVLSVDTKDEKIVDFIKARLNYKKVSGVLPLGYDEYIVPVRLKKE
ncbi:hypothetical protein ACFSTE_10270 [Aquimarina hainanensis]|uniref:TonB C-terminal domain-containing protein n=1 Tax=Aquimarina hainanensis TaxID=1578017 RepID=A0ABW5N7F9_9FLAO|nr:hypothetical protein [Aquimarina sp. TRL1]QKX05700.1 hypothetical protein HN014_12535 [Aquimarina sp. TRL1]